MKLASFKPGDLVYGLNQSRKNYRIPDWKHQIPTVDQYSKCFLELHQKLPSAPQTLPSASCTDLQHYSDFYNFCVDNFHGYTAIPFKSTLYTPNDEEKEREWTLAVCKAGIDFIRGRKENRIHFVLDGLDFEIKYCSSFTVQELKYIYQTPKKGDCCTFYLKGNIVQPPWMTHEQTWKKFIECLPNKDTSIQKVNPRTRLEYGVNPKSSRLLFDEE